MTVQVACRIRPMLTTDTGDVCVQVQGNYCTILNENNQQHFTFDKVFGPESSQEEVFDMAKPLVDASLNGMNATIFSFGATCAGKSYTIFGPDEENPGIIPRTIQYIFDFIQKSEDKYYLSVSFLEIYLERVRDLLDQQKLNLNVLDQDSAVPDATDIPISSIQQLSQLIQKANAFKVMAPNKINQQSSRSHCILILNILQQRENKQRMSKLFLVDLAGSEKISRTEAQGLRLSEAKNINKSLLALGKVVNCITSQSQHIPYRDSKLTRLLKCSLGGNSKTFLIVHIAPTEDSLQESLSTLLFASRARSVKNVISINEFSDSVNLVQELIKAKEIINKLRHNQVINNRTLELYQQSEQDFINNLGQNESFSSDYRSEAESEDFCNSVELNKLRHDSVLLNELLKKQGIVLEEQSIEAAEICDNNDIFSVIQQRSLQMLHALMEQIKQQMKQYNENGENVLTYAAQCRFYQSIPVLLRNGADVYQCSKGGNYPMHALLQEVGSLKESQQKDFSLALSTLINYMQENLEIRDSQNRYCIQVLIQQQNEFKYNILQKLLHHEFDVYMEVSKEDQWYAVMDCVYAKDAKSLEMLIRYIFQKFYNGTAANLEATGIFRAFHLSIKLLDKNCFLVFLQVEELHNFIINCEFQQLSAIELAFQVQNFEAFTKLTEENAKISQQFFDKVFCSGSVPYCSALLGGGQAELSCDTAFTIALSRGSVQLLQLIQQKCDYSIDEQTVELCRQMHGQCEFFQFVQQLYKPSLYEEFEGVLKRQQYNQIGKRFAGLTKQLPDSKVNYLEFLYLKGVDTEIAQNIVQQVGWSGLDKSNVERIAVNKRDEKWVQVLQMMK